MAHDRSSKKPAHQDIEANKSGVSLKGTMKNDSKVSTGKGVEKEKVPEVKAPPL